MKDSHFRFVRVRRFTYFCALAISCAIASPGICEAPDESTPNSQSLSFELTYAPEVAESFTGRVYVMFGTPGRRDPRFGPGWFSDTPFFALDVADWKPDTPLIVDDSALGFPMRMSEVPQREWAVQAVMRINRDSPTIGNGPGSAYSDVLVKNIRGSDDDTIALHIDRIVAERPFRERDSMRYIELRSDLLSEFHGRDTLMRAVAILPDDANQDPDRRYPAMYWIGGFGSDHHTAPMVRRSFSRTGYGNRIVRIVLDPLCYGGHHTFADSANNGPVGAALVTEFIPHLEATLPIVAAPTARFLSGHSSGGWSSLWLQITHPEFFGGTWSLAPDPVDFRSFQRINLYAEAANMYRDETGARRPIARSDEDEIVGWYDDFIRMETVHGEGGQIRSFEWVFSPRGPDGLPAQLFDRATGQVNPDIALAWQRYDIRHVLESNWPALGPKLAGKIHIFMGAQDTFYLEGATQLLKDAMQRLGSDAVIEITPGADHGSISTPALRQRIDREMLAVFEQHHPDHALPPVTAD